MYLYNASLALGLVNEVRYLTNTNTTNYPATDVTRNINRYYHLIVSEILASMDDWDFGGEYATTDLVANQREYPFPSDCLKIKRVEVKLRNNGDEWVTAAFFDINEVSDPMSTEADIISVFDNDTPYVELMDNSMFIYSGTIPAVAGGVKIWYDKESSELSADTDEPSFAEPFHRLLVYGAAKDFFSRYEMKDKVSEMDAEFEKLMGRLKLFYGTKDVDRLYILKTPTSTEDYE